MAIMENACKISENVEGNQQINKEGVNFPNDFVSL